MADAERKTAEWAAEPPQTPVSKGETALGCGFAAVVFLLGVRAISSSLWLDETATYWVIKDGLGALWVRVWEWPGASPVYDLTAWPGHFLAPVLGLEAALRVPSVLAALAAAGLLFRLGERLAGRRAALIGVAAFFSIYDVAFATIDARPYALGLALLLASMLAMVRYLDTGKRRWAAAYVAASALVVYTHSFLAMGLAAQLVYGWRERRRLAAWWMATAVLCLPLAGQAIGLYRTRGEHLFSSGAELPALVRGVAPMALAAAVFLGGMLGRRTNTVRQFPRAFLLTWVLLPPLLLFVAAVAADAAIFVPRYFLAAAPALALLAGWMLARVTSAGAAGALLLTIFACLYGKATVQHGVDDWRGATAAIDAQARPGDAILVASGFVEATPRNLGRDVLFSPQMVYPIPGMIRLPFKPEPSAVPADFGGAPRVFLLCSESQLKYADWMAQGLAGYGERKLGPFGDLEVVRFER